MIPATVNEATKHATPKHTHNQAGVFSSAIPQIFSVIQEKLLAWPTSSALGRTAGLTSSRIAGAPRLCSAAWAIVSGLIRAVLVEVLHAAQGELAVVRHPRVRVAQPCQVRRPRPGVQVAEQGVVLLPRLGLRHLGPRVGDVAEHDRLRRAGLLAGGPDRAIGHHHVLRMALLGDLHLPLALAALD